MFSNWSRRWISRAIVTPSLVTTGDPVIFSRMTLRPFGPSVDLTASASWSTPETSSLRASSPNRRSLAMGSPGCGWWVVLGNEDGPAADLAGVEVVQRLLGGVEGVGPGVQGDLPRLREDHQL